MTATLFLRLLGLMTSLGFGYLVFDYADPSEEVTHAVAGGIRVEGRPLEKGVIRFVSMADSKPRGAGAFVKNGEYAILKENGLLAGKYLVQISGIGPEEANQAIRAGGGEFAKLRDPVPARFNRESEIYVEVAADGSLLGFDFDLK